MKYGWSLVLAAGLAGSSAVAQDRLPPPPAPVEKGVEFDRAENFDAFLRAYQRSGSPRLLIVADAPGWRDHGEVAEALRERVEGYFRAPEVEVIEPGALGVALADQIRAFARNEEYAAARAIGERAKADVVVLVRLAGPHAGSAGSYTIADLRRGTSIGKHSWIVRPAAGEDALTPTRVGEYSRAIARRVGAEFCRAYPEGGALANMRRVAVRLAGSLPDDDLVAFRDSLREVRGVKGDSVRLREHDGAPAGGTAEFDLFYAGELIDLRAEVARVTLDTMGMRARVVRAVEPAIDLVLEPTTLSAIGRSLSGGPESSRNRADREALRAAYERAGSPTLAFVVTTPVVAGDDAIAIATDTIPAGSPQGAGPAPLQHGEVNVIVGDRFGVDAFFPGAVDDRLIERELADRRRERLQDEAIDTVLVENKLVERVARLGLTPRDVSGAQAELLRSGALAPSGVPERVLAVELARKAGAGIVVSGVGRLVRDRASGEARRLSFTFRAYDAGSGDVLAAASVTRDLSPGDAPLNRMVDEIAAEATGSLAEQLLARWGRAAMTPVPPPATRVEVTTPQRTVTTEVTRP